MNRLTWDEYFLNLATAAAGRADCTRRMVGCVLVADDRRVISTGYNGAPPGAPGCKSAGACPRGKASFDEVPARSQYASGAGACIAIHAEDNALRYADRPVATAYITDEPCPGCFSLLTGAGVTRAVWPEGERVLS